ncbi:MAG TPA: hypothetical protein VEF05_02300 [Terriglobales bacterium]|nr:hypothetical protein [Terriglobales bacterium]
MTRRLKKVTDDTLVFLKDIVGAAEFLENEVGRIEGVLFDTDNKVADPKAFEEEIDDIAREIFKQYLRLQEVLAEKPVYERMEDTK